MRRIKQNELLETIANEVKPLIVIKQPKRQVKLKIIIKD